MGWINTIDWGETCALVLAVIGFFKGGKWAKQKVRAAPKPPSSSTDDPGRTRCRYRFGDQPTSVRCTLQGGHQGAHRP